MSTFYLLPPRDVLSRRFAEYLGSVFPGIDWKDTADLSATLEDLAEARSDVFVLYREDLPTGDDLSETLRDCYGVEDEDLIVEVPDNPVDAAGQPRFWRLGKAA